MRITKVIMLLAPLCIALMAMQGCGGVKTMNNSGGQSYYYKGSLKYDADGKLFLTDYASWTFMFVEKGSKYDELVEKLANNANREIELGSEDVTYVVEISDVIEFYGDRVVEKKEVEAEENSSKMIPTIRVDSIITLNHKILGISDLVITIAGVYQSHIDFNEAGEMIDTTNEQEISDRTVIHIRPDYTYQLTNYKSEDDKAMDVYSGEWRLTSPFELVLLQNSPSDDSHYFKIAPAKEQLIPLLEKGGTEDTNSLTLTKVYL